MTRQTYGRLITLLLVVAFAAVGYFALAQERNPHGDLAEWNRKHGEVVNKNQDPQRFCYKCHEAGAAYCNQCHQAQNVKLNIQLP